MFEIILRPNSHEIKLKIWTSTFSSFRYQIMETKQLFEFGHDYKGEWEKHVYANIHQIPESSFLESYRNYADLGSTDSGSDAASAVAPRPPPPLRPLPSAEVFSACILDINGENSGEFYGTVRVKTSNLVFVPANKGGV